MSASTGVTLATFTKPLSFFSKLMPSTDSTAAFSETSPSLATQKVNGTVHTVDTAFPSGYVRYTIRTNVKGLYKIYVQLNYSDPNFVELRNQLQPGSKYQFTIPVKPLVPESRDYTILSIALFQIQYHLISGKIENFLDINGKILSLNSPLSPESKVEVILEERPIKVPGKDGYIKLVISGDRIVSLPRHLPVQLKLQDNGANIYSIEEVTLIK
jgi:hypothetical protein